MAAKLSLVAIIFVACPIIIYYQFRNADTEKNEKRKAFWADFLQRVQSSGRLFTLALIFTATLLHGVKGIDEPEGAF